MTLYNLITSCLMDEQRFSISVYDNFIAEDPKEIISDTKDSLEENCEYLDCEVTSWFIAENTIFVDCVDEEMM